MQGQLAVQQRAAVASESLRGAPLRGALLEGALLRKALLPEALLPEEGWPVAEKPRGEGLLSARPPGVPQQGSQGVEEEEDYSREEEVEEEDCSRVVAVAVAVAWQQPRVVR